MPLDHALYSDPGHVLTTWRTRAERLAALEALGLKVAVDTDFRRYADFITATDWPVVSPVIDPNRHNFSGDEALWLSLITPEGRIVGTQCVRRVESTDYIGLLRAGRLFGDAMPGYRWLVPKDVEATMPRIAGTIVHTTGLWIAPDWRRKRTRTGDRLVSAFGRFTHAFTLDFYRLDWSASLVDMKIAKPRLIHDLYAYPHMVEACECDQPGEDRKIRLALTWASAGELRDLPNQTLPQAA